MTSTVLHGLDDADIPEAFTDELLIAVGDEVMARPAVLLNALLLAGWTPPPKRQREKWAPLKDYCGKGICAMLDGHEGECRV